MWDTNINYFCEVPKPKKVERFKSKYVMERSAYRLDHDTHIVHMRLLSPIDKHCEYFSYTIERGHQVWAVAAENKEWAKMEKKIDDHIKAVNSKKIDRLRNVASFIDKLNRSK